MASRELCALKMTVHDIRTIGEEIVGELSWSTVISLVKNVVGICIGIAIMVIPVVLFFVGLHQYLQSISVVIWIPLLFMYELIVLAIILLYIVNYEDCKNKD
jgi:hypothetical protein